jgi:NAD(P)-dependent dehydrogenase (short-subunit alcohol dehydrogenase family)
MALLNQKVAIVTGASSGIGRAAALLFAREGARVVIGARRRNELETLVGEIAATGGEARLVAGDVRDERFAAALVDTACTEFGGLDVAFNNAGTLGALGPSTQVSLEAWRNTLDTNLTGAFLAAQRQLPALLARGGGSLIFTSTFVGHTAAFPGTAAYAASKAGIIGLTQALAVEYGPQGVRVNALLPGGTDTPMGRSMNPSPEAQAAVAALHALKRLARPEEQACAALYLACDLSSFMTGATLLVDGGVSINRS